MYDNPMKIGKKKEREREKIIRYFYHRTLMNPILFRCLCVYGDNGSSTSKI